VEWAPNQILIRCNYCNKPVSNASPGAAPKHKVSFSSVVEMIHSLTAAFSLQPARIVVGRCPAVRFV
jgi:hypothetical protein